MKSSTQSFYDELAASYHLIFADWEASIRRQGELLDTLIRAELGRGPQDGVTVLDCSCGIGTQAIGLAARGYRVHATDLSPAAVERAGREAERLGISITTGVADFRSLADQVEGQYEVVLSFDNALPHLLTDDDLRLAARNIAATTAPGGVFLASIRDYDALIETRPQFDGLRRMDGPDGPRIAFQMWEWDGDGARYTVHQFILRATDLDAGVDPVPGVDLNIQVDPATGVDLNIQVDRKWITEHYQTRYRALRRAELERFLAEAGFGAIRWDMTGFYQPVVIARRSTTHPARG